MSQVPPYNPNDPKASPYATPQSAGMPTTYGQGDATGGVIPYKNVPALIAYYLGIFSLLPCIGIVLGPPAVILGIIGLVKKKQNPAVKGTLHAIIGIVLGGICTALWGGLIVLGIIGGAAT